MIAAAQSGRPAATASAPRRRRYPAWYAVVGFLAVATAISLRTLLSLNVPDQPREAYYGLVDFRDAIYYPVVSFLDGHNPYDPISFAGTYPVVSTFALYAPHTLLVHLPFGLLPPRGAGLVYFGLSLVLTLVLARIVLQVCRLETTVGRVFGLAAMMLLSRPGESSLFLGQYTVTVCLGVYLALGFGSARPWLAALGLALALVKPSFGVPLVVLLAAGHGLRVALMGLAVAGVLSILPAASIASSLGGVTGAIDLIRSNQQVFGASMHFAAASSVTRIDAISLMARLFGSLGPVMELGITSLILVSAAVAVRRLSRLGTLAARHLSDHLVCLTIVTCMYHQGYDALLLALPLTMLLLAPSQLPSIGHRLRVVLVALLTIPAVNYVSTYSVVQGLSLSGMALTALASLNAAAVFVAWGIYMALAIGLEGTPTRHPVGTRHA